MTEHQLEVLEDAEAAARRAAELIAQTAAEAIDSSGKFTLAASGGKEPWVMYRMLGDFDIDWQRTEVFQVDSASPPTATRTETSPT